MIQWIRTGRLSRNKLSLPLGTQDSADAKAFELLKLFAGENLDSFNKFYAANTAYVNGLGAPLAPLLLLPQCHSELPSQSRESEFPAYPHTPRTPFFQNA
jgi:hypothetical protein